MTSPFVIVPLWALFGTAGESKLQLYSQQKNIVVVLKNAIMIKQSNIIEPLLLQKFIKNSRPFYYILD
jgi:hypothetical protein